MLRYYLSVKGNDFSLASGLMSYGCWCQLRNQVAGGIVPGHGSPTDGLDSLCQKWHQCRSCTTIDSTNESCNPNETLYNANFFDPSTNRVYCEFNPTNCAINTCKCDEELAFELVASLNEMSDITQLDGFGFDHANNCKSTTGTNNNGGNGSNEP